MDKNNMSVKNSFNEFLGVAEDKNFSKKRHFGSKFDCVLGFWVSSTLKTSR